MNVKNVMKGLKLFYPKPNLSKPRLVTINLSHFSEKSRWALDMSPMKEDYYEEMHGPALHLTTTLVELAGVPRVQTWDNDSIFQQAVDSRYPEKMAKAKNLTGVPKLVLPRPFLEKYGINAPGKSRSVVVAGGSAGIVKFLADIFPEEVGFLYPIGSIESTVVETEKMLDMRLGPAATQWSFGNMLLTGPRFFEQPEASGDKISRETNQPSVDLMLSNITKSDIPAFEKTCFNLFGSKAIPRMIKHNHVSAKSRGEAQRQIEELFQHMDTVLAKNNPSGSVNKHFLLGTDQITAADIAFASLALPVLMPTREQPFFLTRKQISSFVESADGCADLNLSASKVPGIAQMLAVAIKLLDKYKSARYAMELHEQHRPPVQLS